MKINDKYLDVATCIFRRKKQIFLMQIMAFSLVLVLKQALSIRKKACKLMTNILMLLAGTTWDICITKK